MGAVAGRVRLAAEGAGPPGPQPAHAHRGFRGAAAVHPAPDGVPDGRGGDAVAGRIRPGVPRMAPEGPARGLQRPLSCLGAREGGIFAPRTGPPENGPWRPRPGLAAPGRDMGCAATLVPAGAGLDTRAARLARTNGPGYLVPKRGTGPFRPVPAPFRAVPGPFPRIASDRTVRHPDPYPARGG